MTDSNLAKHVVLCPGQGAQHVGMAQSWFEQSPAAGRVFAEADTLLGFGLGEVCFNGPAERLTRTDIGQPAIYVASVACYRGLSEAGRIGQTIAAAGLSLGEFTALHLAGVFDFATGLELVRVRGKAMQEAAEAVPSGMLAVVGADEEIAETLCQRAKGSEVLVPANFNCPGQVVISGAASACDRALEAARDMGLRATPLPVAGAFHSPLMQPAADRLAKALAQADFAPPTIDVVSNVTAQPHRLDAESIKTRLVDQLTSPVRWEASIRWLNNNYTDPMIELAPGNVLSGLMRRIDRNVKVQNFAKAESAAPCTH